MAPELLWRNTQRVHGFWRDTLQASGVELRALKHGIYDPPIATHRSKTKFCLPEIPVLPSDSKWLKQELADALHRRVYEELSPSEAFSFHSQDFPVSSAFIVHQSNKLRLVVNFARQSKLFRELPVKMETLERFGMDLLPGDHLLSFDIEKGYHHFCLHP